jgi:hypothetical protein
MMIESLHSALGVRAVGPMGLRHAQYHVVNRQLLVIVRIVVVVVIIIIVVVVVHVRCLNHISTNVCNLLDRWSRGGG